MILRRVILALAGAAVLAASAAVCVVALAFGLYAWVEPTLGRAGAAGVVAGATALLVAAAAAALLIASRGKRRKVALVPNRTALDRSLDFVRDQPVLAIIGAVGAGLLAVRNPEYLGSAVRAFFEGRPPKSR